MACSTHSVVLYICFNICYFGVHVKSHRVYLSLYLPLFVMGLSTLLTLIFHSISVCLAFPVAFCIQACVLLVALCQCSSW